MSANNNRAVIAYLKLDLQQWWGVDNGHFHPLLLPAYLYYVIEVSPKSIVQIEPLIGHIDVQMRKYVLLLMRREGTLTPVVCRGAQGRQPLPLLTIEQTKRSKKSVCTYHLSDKLTA